MIVTIMKARFRVPHFRTLKERRGLIQSLKSRVAKDFGVSVCQTTASPEDPRSFELGLALVSSDAVLAGKDTERIREFLSAASEEHLTDFDVSSERW